MTMHLAHPALSLTGKKKGKIKFKSAEAKRQHEQLEAEWKTLKAKYAQADDDKKRTRALKAEPLNYKLSTPIGRDTKHIPSRNTGHTGAVTIKQTPQYTGTKILGIGTMHKSNAVPVFSDEEAQDISRMRR
jgi:hypothetical protein